MKFKKVKLAFETKQDHYFKSANKCYPVEMCWLNWFPPFGWMLCFPTKEGQPPIVEAGVPIGEIEGLLPPLPAQYYADKRAGLVK